MSIGDKGVELALVGAIDTTSFNPPPPNYFNYPNYPNHPTFHNIFWTPPNNFLPPVSEMGMLISRCLLAASFHFALSILLLFFFFWLLAYLFKIKGKIKVERIGIKQIIEIKKTIRKEGSKKVELEKEEWRKERGVALLYLIKNWEEISMASLSRALRILG